MARKAKDLDSLRRLQEWAVDERRRELGVLLAREAALIEQDRGFDRQFEAERDVARGNPTLAGHNFSVFIAHHLRKKEAMAMLLTNLRAEIEAARDRLGEAYREQKVLDEVRKSRIEAQRLEDGQREQAFFDEVAQTQFARKESV